MACYSSNPSHLRRRTGRAPNAFIAAIPACSSTGHPPGKVLSGGTKKTPPKDEDRGDLLTNGEVNE